MTFAGGINSIEVLLAIAGICAFTLIALLRPAIGVYVLTGILPFETVGGVPFLVTKAIKLAAAGCLAAICLGNMGVLRRAYGLKGRPFMYGAVLLLFTGSCLISTVSASDVSWSAIGLAQLIVVFLYGYALSQIDLGPHGVKRILVICLWAGVLVSVWAVVQCVFGYQGVWASVEQTNYRPLHEMDGPIWGLFRGSGPFSSCNEAAAYLGIVGLCATIHALLIRQRRKLYIGLACLFWVGLASTFSRGALIGAFCAFAFLVVASPGMRFRRTIIAALVCSLAAAFYFSTTDLGQRYFRADAQYAEGIAVRAESWSEAASLIEERPLLGWGVYSFQQRSDYTGDDPTRHPHNGLLKTLVEQGALGGALYLALLLAVLRNSFLLMVRLRREPLKYWQAASLGCGAVALFTHEFVDAGMTIGGSSVAILFITFLGLQARMMNESARAFAAPVKWNRVVVPASWSRA